MPSPIGHSLIGLGFANFMFGCNIVKKENTGLVIFVVIFSIMPDFDFLFVLLGGNPHYHREITHSLLFAFISLAFVLVVNRKKRKFAFLAFYLICLHVISDALVPPGILPMPIKPFYPLEYHLNLPVRIFSNITWMTWDYIFSIETLIALIKELGISLGIFWVMTFISSRKRGSIERP